jgi:hypothetical protein
MNLANYKSDHGFSVYARKRTEHSPVRGA